MPTYAQCAANPFDVALVKRVSYLRNLWFASRLILVPSEEYRLMKYSVETSLPGGLTKEQSLQIVRDEWRSRFVLELGEGEQYTFPRQGNYGLGETLRGVQSTLFGPFLSSWFCGLEAELDISNVASFFNELPASCRLIAQLRSNLSSDAVDRDLFIYFDRSMPKIGSFTMLRTSANFNNNSKKFSTLNGVSDSERFVPYGVRVLLRVPRAFEHRPFEYTLGTFVVMLLENDRDQVHSQLMNLGVAAPFFLGSIEQTARMINASGDYQEFLRSGVMRPRRVQANRNSSGNHADEPDGYTYFHPRVHASNPPVFVAEPNPVDSESSTPESIPDVDDGKLKRSIRF